jgi:DNA-binding NarL/FixJ family response regulator
VTKLHRLGLSFRQIAKNLGIDDKTVAKACRSMSAPR